MPGTLAEVRYKSVRFIGTNLIIQMSEKTISGRVEATLQLDIKIPLSAVDPERLAVIKPVGGEGSFPDGGVYRLEINTKGGKKTISTRAVHSDSPEVTQIMQSDQSLYFTERENAERVGKAIAHASILFSGKANPQ